MSGTTTALREADTVFTAATVDEATRAGLEEQGLAPPDAVVTVVDAGSRGFLGFRSRPARVQVVPRDPLIPVVRDTARELLERMGFEGEVSVRQEGRRVDVSIRAGKGEAILIGRRGETLDALQHLILRLAGRKLGDGLEGVTLDVAGYRARRDEKLSHMARQLAERVERTGRREMTEPLGPRERRVVHRALEGRRGVTTQVGGRGGGQRIIITPRKRGGAGRSG